MIKVLIGDADGMMITGERYSSRFSREFNVPIEKVNDFFNNEFKGCLLGKDDLKEKLQPYLKMWGWKGSLDALLLFWFAESYRVDVQMIEAMRDVRASGIQCVLATNQEKYRLAYIKNEMGLGKEFDAIYAASDFGVKKPDSVFFDAIMKTLPGIERNEVIFWDDRQENVDSARAYGFHAEMYKGVKDFREMSVVVRTLI